MHRLLSELGTVQVNMVDTTPSLQMEKEEHGCF